MSRPHRSQGRAGRGAPPRWARAAIVSAICGVGSGAGCAREPLPDLCPNVEAGELVISELRGPQDEDQATQYIEVYNAAGKTVDLEGLRVQVLSSMGDLDEMLVRSPVELEPGQYAVLGLDPNQNYDWVDFELSGDVFVDELIRWEAGKVSLEACGEIVDEVGFGFGDLPVIGTRACGNAESPPSAAVNDDVGAGCWCTDAEDFGGGIYGLGQPGTPGEVNRCP